MPDRRFGECLTGPPHGHQPSERRLDVVAQALSLARGGERRVALQVRDYLGKAGDLRKRRGIDAQPVAQHHVRGRRIGRPEQFPAQSRSAGQQFHRDQRPEGGDAHDTQARRRGSTRSRWRSTMCAAAGFGLGVATVYRYVTEAVDLLAGLAGCPTATLLRARPGALVILDGTLIETDRTPDRANYSGKHHRYGVNIQQLTDARGIPLWSSPGRPGSTHDLAAARAHGLLPLLAHLSATGVVVLADKGYQGIGAGVLTPYKGNDLTPPYRTANAAHAAARSVGERGFALEKHWQVLRRYRGSPQRVDKLVTAIRVLERQESESG